MRRNKRHAEFEFRATVHSLPSGSARHWQRALLALLGAVALAALSSCKKSPPRDSAEERAHPSPSSNHQSEVIARVHWLGKKRIVAETNAASFMQVWNLPESVRLEEQTLDRLSTAPWRLLKGDTNAAPTNGTAALLRPLLDDLVQQEWLLEVRQPTNQPGEAGLAIRLSPERAKLWETNLAAVLESWTGARVGRAESGPDGWQLPITNWPRQIPSERAAAGQLGLTRSGQWTVLGLGHGKNTVVEDMRMRIQRGHVPFAARPTDLWLEAKLDLPRLADAIGFGWHPPQDLPRISLSVIGDGKNVRTHAYLDFPRPLPFELEPWNIPTNLIHDPLASFTAIQGIKPWLATLKIWNELQVGEPPNQFYAWAQDGITFQSYFATPLPDASNVVFQLADDLLQAGNQWIATNGIGKFERFQRLNGATWKDVPFMAPHLQSVAGNFVLGGFFPFPPTNRPPPPELFQTMQGQTNLVGYAWELTGPRIEQWLDISQLLRLVFHKPQLPSKAVSIAWLKAAEARLGNSVTLVTRTKPDQALFIRESGVGFTALELHLLADWLESPQFPCGLYSFLAPMSARPRAGQHTNSVGSPGPHPPGLEPPKLQSR